MMAPLTQSGYFLLTDLSGYTSFVAKTELEHAHDILSDLLRTVCESIQQHLTIHKLEGDAVFAYIPESRMQRGETLLELIESTYVAFRDRRTSIQRGTTCTCKACSNIPSLDLKFITHFGEYILQDVANIKEMVGSDVNLVHRLSKNHTTEATGWRAYILLTAKCIEKLNLDLTNTFALTEKYEHLGELQTFSLNLHARYDGLVAERRFSLKEKEADLVLRVNFPTPPPASWEWLEDPNKRNLWGGDVHWSAGARMMGRTSTGSKNHCAHGKGTSTEVILDWRPFEYSTKELYQNGKKVFTETVRYEVVPDGTTRVADLLQVNISGPRFIRKILARFFFITIYRMDKLLSKAARLAGEETSHTTIQGI
jgi:class 3 adenylate cyclase